LGQAVKEALHNHTLTHLMIS